MMYEILRLSSGWLLSCPGPDESIKTKFSIDIADLVADILLHAKDNPPPYGAGYEPQYTEIYVAGTPGS